MRNHKAALAAVLVGTALVLAACGGGGGGDDSPAVVVPPPAPTIPTTAQQTISGVIAFLNELIGNTSNSTEPLALGALALATDESSEPVDLP